MPPMKVKKHAVRKSREIVKGEGGGAVKGGRGVEQVYQKKIRGKAATQPSDESTSTGGMLTDDETVSSFSTLDALAPLAQAAQAADSDEEAAALALHTIFLKRGPRAAAEAAYRGILAAAFGGPLQLAAHPELTKTPARAAKAFFEINHGLTLADPLEAVGAGVFDLAESRDLVSVRDVQFHSLCEHHLLPFSGRANFAYIADGRVLGLSKFARLLEAFARRPQVQERLTRQVAEAILQILRPRVVAVVLEARHTCMSIRGALQPNAGTRTMVICGPDSQDPATKQMIQGILEAPSARF